MRLVAVPPGVDGPVNVHELVGPDGGFAGEVIGDVKLARLPGSFAVLHDLLQGGGHEVAGTKVDPGKARLGVLVGGVGPRSALLGIRIARVLA